MMTIRKLFFIILTCSFLAVLPLLVYAGGKGGLAPCQGADPPPWCNAIPIDGGIGVLLAAGIAYGARKIYDTNKKQK